VGVFAKYTHRNVGNSHTYFSALPECPDRTGTWSRAWRIDLNLGPTGLSREKTLSATHKP